MAAWLEACQLAPELSRDCPGGDQHAMQGDTKAMHVPSPLLLCCFHSFGLHRCILPAQALLCCFPVVGPCLLSAHINKRNSTTRKSCHLCWFTGKRTNSGAVKSSQGLIPHTITSQHYLTLRCHQESHSTLQFYCFVLRSNITTREREKEKFSTHWLTPLNGHNS